MCDNAEWLCNDIVLYSIAVECGGARRIVDDLAFAFGFDETCYTSHLLDLALTPV